MAKHHRLFAARAHLLELAGEPAEAAKACAQAVPTLEPFRGGNLALGPLTPKPVPMWADPRNGRRRGPIRNRPQNEASTHVVYEIRYTTPHLIEVSGALA
jgi:hypothetical protein